MPGKGPGRGRGAVSALGRDSSVRVMLTSGGNTAGSGNSQCKGPGVAFPSVWEEQLRGQVRGRVASHGRAFAGSLGFAPNALRVLGAWGVGQGAEEGVLVTGCGQCYPETHQGQPDWLGATGNSAGEWAVPVGEVRCGLPQSTY